MRGNEIIGIDLCCGVGGMTNGLLQAGINVVAGYDLDETCKETYEKNNKVRFYQKDLMSIDSKTLEKHFNDKDYSYIHISPPCQPFSSYTKKGSRLEEHGKYNIADRLFDILLEIKPDFITIEEVPKVLKLKSFQERIKELSKYYNLDQKVINLANWGVPQNRKRYFLIGRKKNEFQEWYENLPTDQQEKEKES